MSEKNMEQQLQETLGLPAAHEVGQSRDRLAAWFAQVAPALYWDAIDSPLDKLILVATRRGLAAISFRDDLNLILAELDPMARSEHSREALRLAIRELEEYFTGRRVRFDLPLDRSYMTPFQKQVMEAAARIPAGSVRTYHQVAEHLGKPQASRAVGQALARNPIPIILPCHRVIGSDGSLHGYAGGLERKRYLLALEGAL